MKRKKTWMPAMEHAAWLWTLLGQREQLAGMFCAGTLQSSGVSSRGPQRSLLAGTVRYSCTKLLQKR